MNANGKIWFKHGLGMITAIMVLILLSLMTVSGVLAQDNPSFAIRLGSDEIHGFGWPLGTPVTTMLWNSMATETGEILVVTTTSEAVNGDTSSPAALIANPGPDGISLVEAILASESTTAYDKIEFDPSLDGAVIALTQRLPIISQGNLTIDGDIDNDTLPDITIDGSNVVVEGMRLMGASHVVIQGLNIRNFLKTGITITPDAAAGSPAVEDLVFRHNSVSNSEYAVMVSIFNQNHTVIQNVEVFSNTLQNNGRGVWVVAGIGDSANDNRISGISIAANTIISSGNTFAIFISAASSSGNSRNTVTDVEITGNQISGHTNSSILIDSANQSGCNDNTVDGVLIANNQIDGTPVTIEFVSVGQSGKNATGNMLSDVTIRDNVLTGGGIQFGGATGYGANNNTISGVLIDRNHISPATSNGVYLVAGSGFAHDNLFENVVIRNTFVRGSEGAGILLHGETSVSPNNTISDVAIANLTLVDNGISSAWAGGLNINSKDASNIISSVTVSNTIMWGNGGGDVIRGSLAPDSVAYSVLNDGRFVGSDGNIYQSPEFVDPGSGDYRLQSDSPCIDTGDPSALQIGPQDLDNKVRLWDGDNDTVAVVDRGAWEYDSILAQEIDLQGKGISILNGDVMPGPWDDTDFGTVDVAEGIVAHIFTIRNTGGISLTLTGDPKVAIIGTPAADFAVTVQPQSPVAASGTTTFTVTFDPSSEGLRSAVISIDNDDSDENPYTFAIQGTGTVPIVVGFDGAPYSYVENIGMATITVMLSEESSETVTVTYDTADGTATTEDGDYFTTGGQLVFAPGETAKTFDVEIIDDARDETAEETIIIELSNAINAVGTPTDTVLIIQDDDDPPTVDFSVGAYSTIEDGDPAPITVTLSALSGLTVKVTFSTADGTATEGADYIGISGTLVFTPDVTSQSFVVVIIDDDVSEGDETVILTLSNVENATIGNNSPAELTISDGLKIHLPLVLR